MTIESRFEREIANFEDCYKHHRLVKREQLCGNQGVECLDCGNIWLMTDEELLAVEKHLGFK